MGSAAKLSKQIFITDVLIVGSEGTGARAALEAANQGLKILVTSKGFVGKSGSTVTADADINLDSRSASELLGFPGSLEDSPEVFAKDMARESEYLGDQELVKIHCEEAPIRVKELVEWGAQCHGLTQASGHSYPRGVWMPGTGLVKTFARKFKETKNVTLLDNFMITDLLTADGRVSGACGLNIVYGTFAVIQAKAVILCTGGATRIYKYTTAPEELTGDGMAMAFRAGAEMVDMEFPMFLPYTMLKPDSLSGVCFPFSFSSFLEAHALNRKGERYLKDWDPVRMERSTRDVNSVAAMMQVLENKGSKNGGTYLSFRHFPKNVIRYAVEQLPPNLANWRYGGFNMQDFLPELANEAIEVIPSAVFWNGGIKINEKCETGVAGLFAAGEGTGSIMGANRISGNAMTMTQVWGYRAGKYAAQYAKQRQGALIDEQQVAACRARLFAPLERDDGIDPVTTKMQLRNLAWDKIGVVRDGKNLEEAVLELERIQREVLPNIAVKSRGTVCNREWIDALQLENIVLIMAMVAKSSLARTESRGALYRRDFPKTDNVNWLKNIVMRNNGGEISISPQDANIKYNQPKREIRDYGRKE